MTKEERDALIEKIRDLGGDSLYGLARQKQLNEDNLIKIAEGYPEYPELLQVYNDVKNISEDLDVSEVNLLSDWQVLSRTLNADQYQDLLSKTLFGTLGKEDLNKFNGLIGNDMMNTLFVNSAINGDKETSFTYARFFKNNDFGDAHGVFEKIEKKESMKDLFTDMGKAFRDAGGKIYEQGCRVVDDVRKVAENINEAVHEAGAEAKAYGVSLMKSAGSFAKVQLQKAKDTHEKLTGVMHSFGKAVQNLCEKGRDNAKAAVLGFGNDMKAVYGTIPEENYMMFCLKGFIKPQEAARSFFKGIADKIEYVGKCYEAKHRLSLENGGNFVDFNNLYTNSKDHTDDAIMDAVKKVQETKAKEPLKVPFFAKVLASPFHAAEKAAQTIRDSVSKEYHNTMFKYKTSMNERMDLQEQINDLIGGREDSETKQLQHEFSIPGKEGSVEFTPNGLRKAMIMTNRMLSRFDASPDRMNELIGKIASQIRPEEVVNNEVRVGANIAGTVFYTTLKQGKDFNFTNTAERELDHVKEAPEMDEPDLEQD